MANMLAQANVSKMKAILNAANTQERLATYMDKADSKAFVMSVLNLYTGDTLLQNCDPNLCLAECMKAAALSLPVARQFGYCYIIPYKDKPSFQMGYKGWLQLAIRSGVYKSITADVVYKGEIPKFNRVTDEFSLEGEPESEEVIGYFARFELNSGFRKAIYWSRERVIAHAKRYSQAYRAGKKDSPWFTAFDSMGCKTVLLQILTRYGVMSSAMQTAYTEDVSDRVEAEVAENANKSAVVIPAEEVEAQQKEAAQAAAEAVETPFPMEGEPQYDPDEEPGF